MKSKATLALVLVALLAIPAAAAAGPNYSQGFETDIAGWDPFGGTFNAIRVASGTGGIPSASGGWHAVSDMTGSSGAASNLGGYTCCFPDGGYVVSVDVYLDFALADGSDKRFDITNAINGTDCSHFVDFVLSIGTNPGNPGEYIMSASQNCQGWPANPGKNPQVILSGTGWYTVTFTFADESGNLGVDIEVTDFNAVQVGFWDMVPDDPTNPGNPIPMTKVSGNRYLWFCSLGGIDLVAFDNSSITAASPCDPVPALPTTWSQIKAMFQN